jgi:hypothetical protein
MEFRMSCVRYLGFAVLVSAASSALPALASEPSTTRIEPRPFYGAVITVEEGVRVFRPLPPHKHVVINPDNRTPVSLGFNEIVEKSYNYYYGEDRPVGSDGGFGGFAGPGLPRRSRDFPASRFGYAAQAAPTPAYTRSARSPTLT